MDLPVPMDHRCHLVVTKLGPALVRVPPPSWPGSTSFVDCVSSPAEFLVGLEGAEIWLGVVSPSGRAF